MWLRALAFSASSCVALGLRSAAGVRSSRVNSIGTGALQAALHGGKGNPRRAKNLVYRLQKEGSELLVVGTYAQLDFRKVRWASALRDEVKLLNPTSAFFYNAMVADLAAEHIATPCAALHLLMQSQKHPKVDLQYLKDKATLIQEYFLAESFDKELKLSASEEQARDEAMGLTRQAYYVGLDGGDVAKAYQTRIGFAGPWSDKFNFEAAHKILKKSPERALVVVPAAHIAADLPDRPSLISLLRTGGYTVTEVGVRGIGPLEPGTE